MWDKYSLFTDGPYSPDVASGTVARRLCIDVHDNADDNDNA